MSAAETKRLNSPEQYRQARRVLLGMGFAEQSETIDGDRMSCVLVAPDGYAARLVFDPKQDAPS